MNRIILIGRLTADPELRYTQNGIARTTFTLAVERSFKDQNGDRQTDFINILAWRGTAENVANHTQKGDLVAVDGRLEINRYENRDGQRVQYPQVVAESVRFLNTKRRQGQHTADDEYRDNDFEQPLDIDDDDLPF